MLNSVTVTNQNGESLTMKLRNPEESGFLITSISGLGPPTASINVTDLASVDGGYFNSARAQNRNIVFNIRFFSENSSDIEGIRQKTYRYFPIKKRVRLVFESDNRVGEIYGYVEKNEPNIFSKETDCQISIICPFPYFYDLTSGNQFLQFSNVVPQFKFIFGKGPINVLTDGNEETEYEYDLINNTHTRAHMKFSSRITDYQVTIRYSGDSDAGIEATLRAYGTVVNPQIYNAVTEEVMQINTTMNAGDRIIVNSTRGNKSIVRIRSGNRTNFLNKMERNSDWITLRSGDNIIGFMADEGTANLTLTVNYKTVFEGM